MECTSSKKTLSSPARRGAEDRSIALQTDILGFGSEVEAFQFMEMIIANN